LKNNGNPDLVAGGKRLDVSSIFKDSAPPPTLRHLGIGVLATTERLFGPVYKNSKDVAVEDRKRHEEKCLK
jgi:hypothetical protein